MFTSPHFIRYNERIRVNGDEVGDQELIAAFERIEAARGAIPLTFFEYNTLAALLIFAQRAVDVAILEVGLGGRLDATNLVAADVAVVASVGLDHRDWLGDTLELIGAEKAGIFRARRPAVLGTPSMPASVFATIAALGARALVAERDFSWRVSGERWDYDGPGVSLRGLPPPALAGSIQYRNAATAIAAVEALESGEAPRAAARRLAGRLPGVGERAEVLAMQLRERALPRALHGRRDPGRTFAVVGVLADKDAAAIAAALSAVIDHWIVCALPGPRGGSAAQLAQRLARPAGEMSLAASVAAGCELARAAARPADRVVVCGSVYTVGPALQWLRIY